MTGLLVYVSFPGTARAALSEYAAIFGGDLDLHTYGEFGRTDGPADSIAHGTLLGPVAIGGSDISGSEPPLKTEGLKLSLLGTADPATLHVWFDKLAAGGLVLSPLQKREWDATDGELIDRHRLHC